VDTDRVDLTDWEKQYIDIPVPELFELVLAANYLAVVPLLHLACKQVALVIKNENMQTIKEKFGVTRDFTPEEEERARKDPAWIDTPSL
jgi:S-phase kinase-associated protein 1